METKKKRRSKWDHLNTPDDFNKFIEENDIKNSRDFCKRFRRVYDRATRLNILKDLILKNKLKDWSNLNTLDDFNKFIEENNIKNPKDFEDRFSGGYSKAKRLGLLKNLKYENKVFNWGHLNTPNDFNKFIKENDIKNSKDFADRFIGGYYKACKLRIIDKLIFENKQFNWKSFNTPDDFNKFIKENNIISYRNFRKNFGGGYNRACKLGLLDKLIFEDKQFSWIHLNTSDDFNKFIKENNIISSNDFNKRFGSGYNKICKLGISNELIYCKGKKEKSSWEIDIYDIIINIPEFINPKREVKFKDCKNKRELPFDIVFSLPNGKIIIIEIQGPRHYTQVFGEEKYFSVRKNDLIKYRWVKEQNNVYLFYFSKPNYHLNENSYFHYIYTSEEELLNDIKKLI